MSKRRGVCCKCNKPVAYRVAFVMPKPQPDPIEPSEAEPKPEEPSAPTESESTWEPPKYKYPVTGRPNPFLSEYEPPGHRADDVCADHIDFFKDTWEDQGLEVTVTPFTPPTLPKGHHVRPKREWSEGRFESTHAAGYGIWIECETLSPESYENRTVTLFLDEDDIVGLMQELKEAAIRTRSQPANDS